jgi:hypothetical protein
MDVPAHVPAAATMLEMTNAENTLTIDREGRLMCRIGFMAVPPFQRLTQPLIPRKPADRCESEQQMV